MIKYDSLYLNCVQVHVLLSKAMIFDIRINKMVDAYEHTVALNPQERECNKCHIVSQVENLERDLREKSQELQDALALKEELLAENKTAVDKVNVAMLLRCTRAMRGCRFCFFLVFFFVLKSF